MHGRIIDPHGGMQLASCCSRPHHLCACLNRRGVAGAVLNVFCKTGKGGGIDPTCGLKSGAATGAGSSSKGWTGRGAKEQSAPRRGYDGVLKQVKAYMDRPDPAKLGATARALSGLSSRELHRLKNETGLTGGGNKAETVAKLASQVVKGVKLSERYAREARAMGHSREILRHYAGQYRKVHNEHADRINSLIKEVRKRFQGANGKPLRRNNPAFNGDDYSKLKGWDSIARELAGNPKYSDLLHNAGYRGSGKGNEKEAYQTLFDLVKAGPVPRMTYKEGYDRAMDTLREMGPTRQRRPGPQGKKQSQTDEPFDLF